METSASQPAGPCADRRPRVRYCLGLLWNSLRRAPHRAATPVATTSCSLRQAACTAPIRTVPLVAAGVLGGLRHGIGDIESGFRGSCCRQNLFACTAERRVAKE